MRRLALLIAFMSVAPAGARTLEEAGDEVLLSDHVADVVVRSTTGDLLGIPADGAHSPTPTPRSPTMLDLVIGARIRL